MSDLETVRQELLERGDEMVSFRQLIERFDEVEKEYPDQLWNLKQIYTNFNILIEEKPNKWIPANRPPKIGGKYIVTRYVFNNDIVGMANYSTDLRKVDKYDFPKHKAGWYSYDSEYGNYELDDVVAWMSSPEPYKAILTGAESEEV